MKIADEVKWFTPLMAFLTWASLSGCTLHTAVVRYHDLGVCYGSDPKATSGYALVGLDDIENQTGTTFSFDPAQLRLQGPVPAPILLPSASAEAQKLLGNHQMQKTDVASSTTPTTFATGALGMFPVPIDDPRPTGAYAVGQHQRFMTYLTSPGSSPGVVLVKDNLTRTARRLLGCGDVDLQLTPYVYVIINGADAANDVRTLAVDPVSGKLAVAPVTPQPLKPEWGLPISMIVDPTMSSVHVTMENGVAYFLRNPSTGAIFEGDANAYYVPYRDTLFNGKSLHRTSLAMEPLGAISYLSNSALSLIVEATSAFSDPNYQTLSQTAEVGNWSLAADPGGQFLFAVNNAVVGATPHGAVAAYKISPIDVDTLGGLVPSSGTLALIGQPLSDHEAWPTDQQVVTTGQFVYSNAAAGISAYSVGPNAGTFSSVGLTPLDLHAQSLSADPSGAYLWAADGASIRTFTIDPVTGKLTPAGQIAASVTSISADPFGRFLYAISTDATSFLSYKVSTTTGALSPADTFTVSKGAHVSAMAVSGTIR